MDNLLGKPYCGEQYPAPDFGASPSFTPIRRGTMNFAVPGLAFHTAMKALVNFGSGYRNQHIFQHICSQGRTMHRTNGRM